MIGHRYQKLLLYSHLSFYILSKFSNWITLKQTKVDIIHHAQYANERGQLSSDLIEIGIDLQDFQPNHEWDIVKFIF